MYLHIRCKMRRKILSVQLLRMFFWNLARRKAFHLKLNTYSFSFNPIQWYLCLLGDPKLNSRAYLISSSDETQTPVCLRFPKACWYRYRSDSERWLTWVRALCKQYVPYTPVAYIRTYRGTGTTAKRSVAGGCLRGAGRPLTTVLYVRTYCTKYTDSGS